MRKVCSVLLALALMLSLFTACGGDPPVSAADSFTQSGAAGSWQGASSHGTADTSEGAAGSSAEQDVSPSGGSGETAGTNETLNGTGGGETPSDVPPDMTGGENQSGNTGSGPDAGETPDPGTSSARNPGEEPAGPDAGNTGMGGEDPDVPRVPNNGSGETTDPDKGNDVNGGEAAPPPSGNEPPSGNGSSSGNDAASGGSTEPAPGEEGKPIPGGDSLADGPHYIDSAPVTGDGLSGESDALQNSPAALPVLLTPEASGVLVKENSKAVIDYSNAGDGYVMVKYTAETDKRLKVIVKGPATQYTYNLTQGEWTVFPLSDGSGNYKITVYQSVETKYASVLSLTCAVELTDEFAPFLRPNQYVNYSADSKAVKKAAVLAESITDPLKTVEVIYDFVVNHLTYDKKKAASVTSGYLPDLDQVMKDEKGICFDYAALMTAMLRSREIPCKLVVGYAGTAYHAWISVWTEEHGWVDGAIYFDGSAWHRMDPTFASSANRSDTIMQYIGDGSNYTVKYLY